MINFSPHHAANSELKEVALFETMGVKTIWLESFDDIPKLLDKISTTPRKKA